MAYPQPTASLSAAAVTTTVSTGIGSTLTDAAPALHSQHAVTFTIASWTGNNFAEINCILEGNIDGTNWFEVTSAVVSTNGSFTLIPHSPTGVLSLSPTLNIRARVFFTNYGTSSPTATVTATIASI
jgi:hypothetical protein